MLELLGITFSCIYTTCFHFVPNKNGQVRKIQNQKHMLVMGAGRGLIKQIKPNITPI
jgi:hypothetical protein